MPLGDRQGYIFYSSEGAIVQAEPLDLHLDRRCRRRAALAHRHANARLARRLLPALTWAIIHSLYSTLRVSRSSILNPSFSVPPSAVLFRFFRYSAVP
jgi:hypothetical protein